MLAVPALAACAGPQSLLEPAGPAAREAARLWWAMLAVAAAVLAGVVLAWLRALHRPSRCHDEDAVRRIGRRWIVIGGLALPAASAAALLAFGIPAGQRMLLWPAAGEAPLRIEVTGHRWWWEVRYPDTGLVLVDELHLPVGRLVEIHVRSADVIHSFWVPRLGGKMDMVPGRTGVLRLRADRSGVFRGQCAEFCGSGHGLMVLRVEAHEGSAFAAWLAARSR
jgi:cytochrome c oxidase subunit 2